MKKKMISAITAVILAVSIMAGGYLSEHEGKDATFPSNTTQNTNTSQQGDNALGNSDKNSANKDQGDKNSAGEAGNDTIGASSTQQSNSNNTSGQAQQSTAQKIEFPYELVEVSQTEGIEPFGYINAKVIKVTDGDTLTVSYNNQDFKVRLLDVDTPESVKAGVEAQPYSKEASDFTKEVLTDKTVRLIFEKGTTDQYGRLLAHLLLEDGTFYNATLIQKGYAISVFYSPNTLLKKYYAELQDKAIADKAGFWSLPEDERPFVLDSKGKYVAAYKLQEKAA